MRCSYCTYTQTSDVRPLISSWDGKVYIQVDNKKLISEIRSEHPSRIISEDSIAIKYCPVCGRKL